MATGFINLCRCKLRAIDPAFWVGRYDEIVIVTYDENPILYFDLESGEIDTILKLQFSVGTQDTMKILAGVRATTLLTCSIATALILKVRGDLIFNDLTAMVSSGELQQLIAVTYLDNYSQTIRLFFPPFTPLSRPKDYTVKIRWKNPAMGLEKEMQIPAVKWLRSGTHIKQILAMMEL